MHCIGPERLGYSLQSGCVQFGAVGLPLWDLSLSRLSVHPVGDSCGLFSFGAWIYPHANLLLSQALVA